MALSSPDPRENFMSYDSNERDTCSNDGLTDETTMAGNHSAPYGTIRKVSVKTYSSWSTAC